MYWNITHTALEAAALDDGHAVSLMGRILGYRRLGGVSFGHICDNSDTKIQFCFNKREIPEETYKAWSGSPHLGDIVGISGRMWTSSTGERTVLVTKDFEILRRAEAPFPDKWNGVQDPELARRKRWLQCAIDPKTRVAFRTRSRLISQIRAFLDGKSFMEVETPVLTPQASGAAARPFVTHHNALDSDFYLRIAPETYLKRMVAGGFDKVFELGKQFRNEGMDPSHLQEFTSVEWYAANFDYMDNMELFNDLLRRLLTTSGHENGILEYRGVSLDFSHIPVVTYRSLFLEYGGGNPDEMNPQEADTFFKTTIRPNLIQPIYVTDYPAHMSPMAGRKPGDTRTVEQWQLIVNGWEIVKCYTELTDSILQRQLLEEQAQARSAGNEEAMMLEEDFLECMEHGMPPMSGLGMGIDRLVCLFTGEENLRDVVFFPTMKASK